MAVAEGESNGIAADQVGVLDRRLDTEKDRRRRRDAMLPAFGTRTRRPQAPARQDGGHPVTPLKGEQVGVDSDSLGCVLHARNGTSRSIVTDMAVPELRIRPGNPDFLDLPWDLPILDWQDPHLVEMPTGIHRHPVVFVAYPEGVYAIKELPVRLARHEFKTLKKLAKRTTRSAIPAGLVVRPWADPHEEYSGAIITRFVDYAFPYRELVSGGGFGSRRTQLLDAFAGLLVELHLAGCFWGDCSLSNVLYRYDAATIEAVMVDAETSRLYNELSIGQREEDLEIMQVNLAGDMSDVAASEGYDLDAADLEIGFDISDRYAALWNELTTDLLIGEEERYRIRERVQRLNTLGFSVADVDVIPDGASHRIRIKVSVGSRTFHSQRLRELTGIDAADNQARQVLSDMRYHRAKHGQPYDPDSLTARNVSAMNWRINRFEPFTARIAGLRPESDPIQGFCDYLNFRFAIAAERGRDVDSATAFEEWIAAGLPGFDPAITSLELGSPQ